MEEIRNCNICKLDQNLDQFYKLKKGGIHPHCKSCTSLKRKKFHLDNKERHNKRGKKYYENNKTRLSQIMKQYRLDHKDEIKEYMKQYKLDNGDLIRDGNKQYYQLNKDKVRKYKQKYDRINRRKLQDKANKRKILRMSTDPLFKLSCVIRTRIRDAHKVLFLKKDKKTEDILGCSFLLFKEHIEKQFDENMNWTNHGTYWEYDHIKPVSLAKNANELYELNYYTNFQPLEKSANRTKSDTYHDCK